MTTLAALLGSLPIALGTGAGAELRQPLGIAIVGGLCVSQVLTLYITPVVYIYLDKINSLLAGRRQHRRKPPAAATSDGAAGRGGRMRRRVAACGDCRSAAGRRDHHRRNAPGRGRMLSAGIRGLRRSFRQAEARQRPSRKALCRLPLGGGPGLFRRRQDISSGPTSPTTACCATTRQAARSRSSSPRPTTTTATRVDRQGRLDLLRASRPLRFAHRTRRIAPRARRPLRGQAAQFAQRRGREVGRLDLVHRSDLRHQFRL